MPPPPHYNICEVPLHYVSTLQKSSVHVLLFLDDGKKCHGLDPQHLLFYPKHALVDEFV